MEGSSKRPRDEFPLFLTLPIDIVDMIAYRAGISGWLALCRTCKQFSVLAFGTRRDAMIRAFTVEVKTDWKVEWKVGRAYHRNGDLPAVIWASGSQEWYKNGEPCRDGDLPAVISAVGSQAWLKNGEWHRDGDLPAVIYADGSQVFYKNGKKMK